MDNDSYKIIITISHHRISYEYRLRGGEEALVGMPCGHWPAPLAFYCSSSGEVSVGEDAALAATNGQKNASSNYFDEVIEGRFYEVGGMKRPLESILLAASEQIFGEFIRTVLCKPYVTVTDLRANMPLCIVCEPDVKANERVFIQRLFKDSGYNRVMVVDYYKYAGQYIRENLARKYVCDKVIVAWTEGRDLLLSLFEINGNGVDARIVLDGMGIDPRLNIVVDAIWKDLIYQNQFLERKDVENAIRRAASDFLSMSRPLVKGEITHPDGSKYRYSLTRSKIDNLQFKEGTVMSERMHRFLAECGVVDKSRALLLLRGVAAGNDYFVKNLRPGFKQVIKSDAPMRWSVMQLIMSEKTPEPNATPSDTDSVKPEKTDTSKPTADVLFSLKKKWRRVKAQAKGKVRSNLKSAALQMLKDFLQECEQVSGTDSIRREIDLEIDSCHTEVLSIDMTQFEKKWREVRAIARGKKRAGDFTQAIKIIQDFLTELPQHPDATQLRANVDAEIVNMKKSSSAATKPVPVKTETPKVSLPGKKNKVKNQGEPIDINNLKETRDTLRAQGQNERALLLTKIIQVRKSVDVRKRTVDECRQLKDKERIGRIIDEIEDFIDLCARADVDAGEYKSLLREYKMIKV